MRTNVIKRGISFLFAVTAFPVRNMHALAKIYVIYKYSAMHISLISVDQLVMYLAWFVTHLTFACHKNILMIIYFTFSII